MKKSFGYVAAFMAGTLLSGGIAFAASNYVKAIKKESIITLNGQTVENAPALVYNGTTYVQLYSIQQALNQTQLNNTWDGYDFDIQTSTNSNSSDVSNSNAYSNLTYSNYQLIDSGYTVDDVNNLFGFNGTLSQETGEGSNYDITAYTWQDPSGFKIVTVMFINGQETSKDQVGLN